MVKHKKKKPKDKKTLHYAPRPSNPLKSWTVKSSEARIMLGAFLQEKLPTALSSRDVKALLERSLCRINGETERFASRRLRPGERISFLIPEESEMHRVPPERLTPDHVIYEDEYCLVLNKPAGYSATPNKSGPGLPEILKGFAEEIGAKKLLLVHRLDRDTSGALLLAKDGRSLDLLSALFKERTIKKAYEAIVNGRMNSEKGIFKSLMARRGEEGGQAFWASAANGQEAITEYAVLSQDNVSTHLRLFPKTGRTHQIRVHLSEAGHPILGDGLYGRKMKLVAQKAPRRQLLHARGLIFVHPITKRPVAVQAPLPKDFKDYLPKPMSHPQS